MILPLETKAKEFYSRLQPKEKTLVKDQLVPYINTFINNWKGLKGRHNPTPTRGPPSKYIIAGVGSILRRDDPLDARDIDLVVVFDKEYLVDGTKEYLFFYQDICEHFKEKYNLTASRTWGSGDCDEGYCSTEELPKLFVTYHRSCCNSNGVAVIFTKEDGKPHKTTERGQFRPVDIKFSKYLLSDWKQFQNDTLDDSIKGKDVRLLYSILYSNLNK